MKTLKKINSVTGVVILAAALMFTSSCQKEQSTLPGNPSDLGNQSLSKLTTGPVIPPNPHGNYAQMSAKWWKWMLELPLACHPSLDEECFDVHDGQSGNVWFLATPVTGAPVERTITIPAGKFLYIGTINVEASNLEPPPFYGATEEERRDAAAAFADLIINVTFTVDDVTIDNTSDYRISSPQINFTAPTPWIFGDVGGNGKSVGDGYFFMLRPMSIGSHTIHYSGAFHFAEGDDLPVDMTYNVTVQ